jgi:hypothetical protein
MRGMKGRMGQVIFLCTFEFLIHFRVLYERGIMFDIEYLSIR